MAPISCEGGNYMIGNYIILIMYFESVSLFPINFREQNICCFFNIEKLCDGDQRDWDAFTHWEDWSFPMNFFGSAFSHHPRLVDVIKMITVHLGCWIVFITMTMSNLHMWHIWLCGSAHAKWSFDWDTTQVYTPPYSYLTTYGL